MPTTKQLNLQHLLWRTGFGPSTKTWSEWQNKDQNSWWLQIRKDSSAQPKFFDVADGAFGGLLMGIGEVGKMEADKKQPNQDERKQMRQESRQRLRSLNLIWLEEMVHTKAQLREKMALFWHGHFASRNLNVLYQQQLLHIFRKHALGNFATLLREVSKSAAMLAFLNNQQNKKEHPNENFAREVMELFTLGRGHYTETDIKEAARAFTGWGFRMNGDFVFRRFFHDAGKKTVLGQTGKFDGDDVLDILLKQRQTAYFITEKLYRFLVNEEQVPEDRVRQLGDLLYDKSYEIMPLLEAIFTSKWFYDDENIGCKIKSPVELWVGIRRSVPLRLDDPEGQLLIQRALGQVLLYPPNVAGWPGGRSWIDSSALMLRLRLPHIIAAQSDLDISPKDDDDQMMGQKSRNRLQRRLDAQVNWESVLSVFSAVPANEMIGYMARFFWQLPKLELPVEVLKKHTNPGSKEQLIQSTALQLMATPEYQLC